MYELLEYNSEEDAKSVAYDIINHNATFTLASSRFSAHTIFIARAGSTKKVSSGTIEAGECIVAVVGRGCFHFDLKKVRGEYFSEKIGVGPSDAQGIAFFLRKVSSFMLE